MLQGSRMTAKEKIFAFIFINKISENNTLLVNNDDF